MKNINQSKHRGFRALLRGALLSAAALTAVLPVNAFAADAAGNYRNLGAGVDSCGKIVKQDGVTGVPAVNKHLNIQWLVGYITSVNVWHHDGVNIAAGTDTDGLYAWALKYCRENPLDSWAGAAEALVRHLENRK